MCLCVVVGGWGGEGGGADCNKEGHLLFYRRDRNGPVLSFFDCLQLVQQQMK